MAKNPEPPKPTRWSIYKITAKAVRLGTVEAPDAAAAMEKGAAEFKVPAANLVRRLCSNWIERADTLPGGARR
jgi:hypothetical protein